MPPSQRRNRETREEMTNRRTETMVEAQRKPSRCTLRVMCKSIICGHRGDPEPVPYFSIPIEEPAHGDATASISTPKHYRATSEGAFLKPLAASCLVHAGRPVERRWPKAPVGLQSPTRQMPGGSGGRKGLEIVQVQPRSSSIDRGLATELESFIFDHQRTGDSSVLVRASSGNVMLFSDLGNLRLANGPPSVPKKFDGPEEQKEADGRDFVIKELPSPTQTSTLLGGKELPEPIQSPILPSGKNPDELKEMGDSEYDKGLFEEAVALYDQAIAVDPSKAAYHTKKAAALMALGLLLEAVAECQAALKVEPAYQRAHHRLANLYLRLGKAERAEHHYSLSGTIASSQDLEQAALLEVHVRKLNEAQRLRDWNTLLREAQLAISCGADSAPQIFAAQAEALLKLQRPEEADTLLTDAPMFNIGELVKFYGASCSSHILSVRAQVDMTMGRFDVAASLAQKAVQFYPYSKDAKVVLRRTQGAATSQSRGNELFKASKFAEACAAYNDGLDHDLNNPVLLCNRASCRINLGQWEKAIKDCNLALQLHPSCNKARLRRADCFGKLEQWEASLEDYKVLLQEMPGDKEVMEGFSEVQSQIENRSTKDGGNINESNLVIIKSNKQFMQIVEGPASVVLFRDKSSESEMKMQLAKRLSQRYLSIKFLLVDEEDLPYLVKQETVDSVPSFRVYRKGSTIKASAGCESEQLEKLIRCLSS